MISCQQPVKSISTPYPNITGKELSCDKFVRIENVDDGKQNTQLCMQVVPEGIRKTWKGRLEECFQVHKKQDSFPSCKPCSEIFSSPQKIQQLSNQKLGFELKQKKNLAAKNGSSVATKYLSLNLPQLLSLLLLLTQIKLSICFLNTARSVVNSVLNISMQGN